MHGQFSDSCFVFSIFGFLDFSCFLFMALRVYRIVRILLLTLQGEAYLQNSALRYYLPSIYERYGNFAYVSRRNNTKFFHIQSNLISLSLGLKLGIFRYPECREFKKNESLKTESLRRKISFGKPISGS